MSAPPLARRPGRPRDPAIDVAVLTATIGALGADGYGGLSVDRIAAAAGVSKATIYRRWASKKELVVAAAEHLSQTVPVPDTGDLRNDLQLIVVELAHLFRRPTTVRLVAALVSGMADDPELAHALRTGFLRVRREAARTVLERGRARGEVEEDLELDLAVDLLAAPLYYRLLITGHEIENRFATQIVDVVMSWISCGSHGRDDISGAGASGAGGGAVTSGAAGSTGTTSSTTGESGKTSSTPFV